MKKILNVLLFVFIMMLSVIFPNNIKAASGSAGLSASTTTVTVGSSVTITASYYGPANTYTVSGSVSSSNASVLQGGSVFYKRDINGFSSCSQSYTFVANSVGSATISLNFSSDDTITLDAETISVGARTITINVVAKPESKPQPQPTPSKPSSPQQPSKPQTQQTKPQVQQNSTQDPQKSGNTKLSSLSISQGSLTPAFHPDTKEYKVSLKSDVKQVKIAAKAADTKASVRGIGDIKVNTGDNKIEVKVSAEDGSVAVYTIHIHVEEKPAAYYEYHKEKLGVIQNEGSLDKLFSECVVSINGSDVKALENKALKMTLLYMINEKTGEKGYYVYDQGKKEIVSSIKKASYNGRNFYVMEAPKALQKQEGMKYKKISLKDVDAYGWEFEEEAFKNYALIYTLSESGKEVIYQYEKSEDDLQIYSHAAAKTQKSYEEDIASAKQETKMYQIATLVTGVVAVGCIIYMILAKKKSLS